MNYEMEDLIPIVAQLTEKYTSKESSSIRYETAVQLMEAVQYCIQEYESFGNQNALLLDQNVSPAKAYERGYQIVLDKVRKAKKCYEQIIMDFHSFGVQCLEDTIIKGMPSFFITYDAKFEPQNQILTLDYPILYDISNVRGIDAIEKYLECIALEQTFLRQLPESYIRNILDAYHNDTPYLFINISSIVMRNILGNILVSKRLERIDFTKEEYDKIEDIVKLNTNDKLHEIFGQILKVLITQQYNGSHELYLYLSKDLEDMVTEVKNMAQYNRLSLMFLI